MMKNVFSFSILFLVVTLSASSQTLRGRVTDVDGEALSYVSVTILRDSNFVCSSITDEQGIFHLDASLISQTEYLLRLSLAGYESLHQKFIFPDTSSIGSMRMMKRQQVLGEVVVSSKKPLVTRKADRYIVNVEGSYLANGQSGLEVLQRSPGLWVNPMGDIKIIGGQTVTVMINDVVQRMSSADLANFLRSLRSEDISRIEVVPNPPAEFEAASSGGIVHIILKKGRQNGLTGNASTSYRIQGNRGQISAGTSLDYKLQRFYITAGINAGIDKTQYTGYSHVIYPDQSSVYNNTLRDNNNRRYMFRAGVVYDFNSKHSLFLQAMTTGSKLLQFFRSDMLYHMQNEDVTGTALSDWRRKPKQGSYTANYGWKTDSIGSSLRVILDHTYSIKTELNELHSTYTDPVRDQTYRTNTPSDTYISSGQIDFTQVLKKQTVFKSGIKYVETKRDNTVFAERYLSNSWQKDVPGSDDYRYSEELLMFYASVEKSIGQTSIKSGLRGEQTEAAGVSKVSGQSIRRKYFGWFPSLFISHSINSEKGSGININYSRRVRRPGYNDLNPYRLQVHDFTVLTGNPDLVPQYAHSFRATYNFSHNFFAGTYFQTVKNYIAQTANTINGNIIKYKSKNFPNSTEYGIYFEGSFSIGKVWNSRSNFSFYQLSNDIDGGKHKRRSFSAQSIEIVRLQKIMEIDVVAQYVSATLNANSKQAYIFFTDIGLTRNIFKDKGRLRFSVTDIFNTFREKNLTEFNQTRIDFYQKRPTRTFGLSFNYSFRAGKIFTKKKLDNNDSDEKSRL